MSSKKLRDDEFAFHLEVLKDESGMRYIVNVSLYEKNLTYETYIHALETYIEHMKTRQGREDFEEAPEMSVDSFH